MTTLRLDSIRVRWFDDEDGRHSAEPLACEAIAEVSYPTGTDGTRRLEWLKSGGLYDIDDPSDAYRLEIETEELDDLREHLTHFGVVISDAEWLRIVTEERERRKVE